MSKYISIDPGANHTGWAVFEGEGLIAYGDINVSKDGYTRRYEVLLAKLDEVIKEHAPAALCMEQATGFKGHPAPELDIACKCIKRWAKAHNLPAFVYNMSTWKTGFAGSVLVEKEGIARLVYLIYPALPRGLIEHTTDAIAIGCFHYSRLKLYEMAGEVYTPEAKRRNSKNASTTRALGGYRYRGLGASRKGFRRGGGGRIK
jgi:Holliday junction resolvasome RuvABC endonuclease subunit